MTDNLLMIGATVACAAAERADTPENKIRAAMKEMAHFWLTTDDDRRFRAALGGALLAIGPDTADGVRLQAEIRFWKAITSGTLEGLPSPGEFQPFGIMQIWKEVTEL